MRFLAPLAAAIVLLGFGYYAARTWNPVRPYIGQPESRHFDAFARYFNNACVDAGSEFASYSTDLRRTDSLTHPLVGEFSAITTSGRVVHVQFGWEDGKWVSVDGRYKDQAAKANR